MKAWRLTNDEADPLKLCDVPVPAPEPGCVVLEVAAAGLCRSDIYLMDRGMSYAASGIRHRGKADGTQVSLPTAMTLGHELAGRIVSVGSGVEGWSEGDLVVSGPAGLGGSSHAAPGVTIDGALAEYCAVPSDRLLTVPRGLTMEIAAVATDAINVGYAAATRAGDVTPEDVVGVVGLGGVGMSGLKAALLRGATVYGVDPNDRTHAAAASAGASGCFSTTRDLEAVSPTVVLDFAGTGESTVEAVRVTAKFGRIVVVGMHTQVASIDTFELIRGQKILRGSHGGTRETLAEVFEHLTSGALLPDLEEVEFADIRSAYSELRRGAFPAKRIFTRPHH